MAKHLKIESYVTAVRQQGGIYTALPVTLSGTSANLTVGGNLTVTGTTSITSDIITSTSANAFAVGPAGTTNPTLQVDASTASAATGLKVKSAAAASGVAISTISSGTDENLTVDAKGAGTVTVNGTATGAISLARNTTVTGTVIGTSTSAAALAVGANGSTNPVFNVDASTVSAATGVTVKGAAAAAGVAITATSSGTDEALKVDAKGAGALTLAATSTGQVSVGRGSVKPPTTSTTITALGTAQNTTPTAAQLRGGVITQTSATGAGTCTLDNGTNISAAVTGVAVGDTFQCIYANLGGAQTVTITGATGSTVIGSAAVASGKNATMTFVNTGTNTWNVYVTLSA